MRFSQIFSRFSCCSISHLDEHNPVAPPGNPTNSIAARSAPLTTTVQTARPELRNRASTASLIEQMSLQRRQITPSPLPEQRSGEAQSAHDVGGETSTANVPFFSPAKNPQVVRVEVEVQSNYEYVVDTPPASPHPLIPDSEEGAAREKMLHDAAPVATVAPVTSLNSETEITSSSITHNADSGTSTNATNVAGNKHTTSVVEPGAVPHLRHIGQGKSIERTLRRTVSELGDYRGTIRPRLSEGKPPEPSQSGNLPSLRMTGPDLRFSPDLRRKNKIAIQSRLIKKLQPPTTVLTPAQYKAIENYTTPAYMSINMRMRAGLHVPEYDLIKPGLDVLMSNGYRYDKHTYRGLSANDNEENPVQNLFPENTTIVERALLSTTYSYEHALMRATSWGDKGALVQLIDNPDSNNAESAVDISRISKVPWEYEVLHSAGKKFEVLLNGYSFKERIYKIVARNPTLAGDHGSVGYVNALLLADKPKHRTRVDRLISPGTAVQTVRE